MTENSAGNLANCASVRYWAFISYCHADREWADWLHKALESYRIPRRIVGSLTSHGPAPLRLAPIFLDRADLAASSDLDATITSALAGSHSLIVLCSPAAAKSPRVIQEIITFRRAATGRVLPVIVAGRPNAEERGGSATEEWQSQ